MEKVEKEKEKDAADLAAVAALAEQERQRKKREENKKKSNLELFKEELKRFDIDPLKKLKKQISISTIYLLNKYLGYKSNAKRDRNDGKKKRVVSIKSPIPYMKKTWMNLRTRPITRELRRVVVARKRERSLLMSMTPLPLIYLLAI